MNIVFARTVEQSKSFVIKDKKVFSYICFLPYSNCLYKKGDG
jgi:hypothetical protein